MTTKECVEVLKCPICGEELAHVGHESGYPYMLNSCKHYVWIRCGNAVWSKYPEWCKQNSRNAIYVVNDKEEWFYAVPR